MARHKLTKAEMAKGRKALKAYWSKHKRKKAKGRKALKAYWSKHKRKKHRK